MNTKKRIGLPEYIASGILILHFITGLFWASDYGVNWDDDFQRLNGQNNWEFIAHHNKAPLVASTDKFHGPVVEILLIAVEKAFHLTSDHDVYTARHTCAFIIFVIGIGVFFLLCRKLFDNSWLALAGMLMLILSPRIFGEGFYNPKDIPFLVAMTLCLYTLLLVSSRPTFFFIFFHAFACAFAMDIRLIAIIFIPITLALLALFIYQRKIDTNWLWIKILLFLGAWLGLSILMWPILTQAVFARLWEAYHQLSNYVLWDGFVKYLGQCYRASVLPWHYHWVWILVSLPEVTILLFIVGVLALMIAAIRKGFIQSTKNVFLLLALVLFLFPLVFRSVKGAIVLDGWRHVYFVFPFLVLLAVHGLERLYQSGHRFIKYGVLVVLVLSLADSGYQIVSMHPYEYVYFNRTANMLFRPIDDQFEMDYWGVSYKQGLEYLLAHHSGDAKIKVSFQDYPGHVNLRFLPPEQQVQFEETSPELADYYLAYYRDFYKCQDASVLPGQVIYTIRAQGNRVLGVHKLR
jgi:hypothetical protein